MSTDELVSPRESTERIGDLRGIATLGEEDDDDSWQSLQRGESVGRYVVLGRVGAGAMGEVFAAYDPDLDRKVALKLLKKRESDGMPRMMREAQAIAKVVHGNVVAVFDVGQHLGRMFVAMEFVEGENLTAWLRRPNLQLPEKLEVLLQSGHGLQAAHDAGLVHRDFKPDNVLVGRDGRARVVDFGLARSVTTRDNSSDERRASTAIVSTELRLTQTGALLGTPAYMAPEQHLRLDCDARSDQFAFCVTAWETIYGVRPFTADSFLTLSVRVTEGRMDPPPPDIRVPGRIRAALVRGLAAKPDDRWPSMNALLGELVRDPGRRRRRIAFAGGLVAIGSSVGFVAAGGLQRSEPPCDPTSSAIAAVWNDEAREAVETAFRAADVPYADDVLHTVVERLDGQREQWSAEYVAACEATHVRGEQSPALLDRRMACLDERRRELAEVVDVLRNADVDVVQRGVDTASGLRSVAPCGDLEAMRRGVAPPPDSAAADVADVRAEVQAALVLDRAGRTPAAVERFAAAVARAEEIGWRPLQVELAVARQNFEKTRSNPAADSVRLRKVFDDALAIGDDRAAAEIANDLGWHYGYLLSQRELGLEWIATAQAFRHVFEFDWLLEVRVLNNEAVIRTGAHDFEGAAPLFERAVALADEREPGGLRAAQLRVNLASFWGERGDYRRAAELLEQTRVGYEALFGPNHPRVGDLYLNLGGMYLMLADTDRAAANFDRSWEILDPVLSPEHSHRTNVLAGQATLERMRGNRDRAVALQRRVLAAREAAKQERDIAMACVNLATALLEGDHRELEVLAEVEALAGRSLAITERIGPMGSQVTPLLLLTDAALRRGDLATAGKWATRAQTAAADPSASVDKQLQVASSTVRVAMEKKDAKGAKAAIDAAELVVLRTDEILALASELISLAKARWDLDYDRPRAIELAERAEALLSRRKDTSGRLDDVRKWLAEHR